MIKKRNAFTLVEVLLYIILTTILVVAGSDAFSSINVNARQVYTMLSDRTNWLFAYRHIAYKVHTSSYIGVTNSGKANSTLTLVDYDGKNIGTYSNSESGLTFSGDGASFSGVAAVFKPGRIKFGRVVEAIVNFSAPYETSAYLKCGVDSIPPKIWAIHIASKLESTIHGPWTDTFMGKIFQQFDMFGNDDGYMYVNSWMTFYRLNKFGELLWSKMTVFSGNEVAYMTDCAPAVNDLLEQDGYVVTGVGVTFDVSGAITDQYTVLAKFDLNGEPVWSSGYKTSPTLNYFSDSRVIQVFDPSGMPDGYMISGNNITSTGNFDNAYLIRTGKLGGWLWTKILSTAERDCYGSIKQVYSATTGTNGFVMAGTVTTFPTITKLDDNGDVEWSKKINFTSSGYKDLNIGSTVYLLPSTTTNYGQSNGEINVKYVSGVPVYSLVCGNYVAEFNSIGEINSSVFYDTGNYGSINCSAATVNNGNVYGGIAYVTIPNPPFSVKKAYSFLVEDTGVMWAKSWNTTNSYHSKMALDIKETFDVGVVDGYIGYAWSYIIAKTDITGNCPEIISPTSRYTTDTQLVSTDLGAIETTYDTIDIPSGTVIDDSPPIIITGLDLMGE